MAKNKDRGSKTGKDKPPVNTTPLRLQEPMDARVVEDTDTKGKS